MKKRFEEIFPEGKNIMIASVQGKPYMFTNLRVERNSVVEKGLFAYDVRDDCDGEFWGIQSFVMVNHWGTIVGKETIVLDERAQYICDPDDSNPDMSSEGWFIKESVNSPEEYLARYGELLELARDEYTIRDKDAVLEFSDERLKVMLENIGEGKCGDYNPDDPSDVNYLRFSVEHRESKSAPWEPVEDASYCTLIEAGAPMKELMEKLRVIWDRYKDAMDSYPEVSVKKLGEELSHLTAEARKEEK